MVVTFIVVLAVVVPSPYHVVGTSVSGVSQKHKLSKTANKHGTKMVDSVPIGERYRCLHVFIMKPYNCIKYAFAGEEVPPS